MLDLMHVLQQTEWTNSTAERFINTRHLSSIRRTATILPELLLYLEHVCGSGQKHFPPTICARKGSIGKAPNGASGSGVSNGHCVGMHGAATPSPSQHDTSFPFGMLPPPLPPSVVPHAYRTPDGAGDPAGRLVRSTLMVPSVAPRAMWTGNHVVLIRTAVADNEGLDLLYGRTVSVLPSATSNANVSLPLLLVQPPITPANNPPPELRTSFWNCAQLLSACII